MSDRWALTTVTITQWDPLRYRWDWGNNVTHKDATMRDESGDFEYPSWGLRIAREIDPDTGTTLNDEGERSIDYRSLNVTNVLVGSDGYISVTGYVEDESENGRPTGVYHRERWDQQFWLDEQEGDLDDNT